MSFIKIGLAAISSLIALTATVSAGVRYNGFPKLGYSVVLPAPAESSQLDARAEHPKTELPVPQSPFRKGGINSRGI